MESMVYDESVKKVIMVCDRAYCEKSNSRVGGAGIEAQIITPEIYRSAQQNKYVAVIKERNENGMPYLPIYYSSKIWIDLENFETYAQEFEKLIRWIWDKPLNKRPIIGSPPSFLIENSSAVAFSTTIPYRRILESAARGTTPSIPLLKDYFERFYSDLSQFKIKQDDIKDKIPDDAVFERIESMRPLITELSIVFHKICLSKIDGQLSECIHRFLERLFEFSEGPQEFPADEVEFDHFKFLSFSAFYTLGSVLVKSENFEALRYILETEYYFDSRFTNSAMKDYSSFNIHCTSLERRNQRLNLQRTSLQADLLKAQIGATDIKFNYTISFDLICFIRSMSVENQRNWWPLTTIYAGRYGKTLEVFARCKSIRYFNKLLPCLGVQTKDEFSAIMKVYHQNPGLMPRFGMMLLDLNDLCGLKTIGTAV